MKINQFLQVVSASLMLSVGFSQKLSAKAIIINSTQDNSSFTTENHSAQSSDLSQFFTTQISQSGENSTTECTNNSVGGGTASTPEPTLISGMIMMAGLGIWSKRKKLLKE